MRRVLSIIAAGAVLAAPAVVVTSSASSAVGTGEVNCSIRFPQCWYPPPGGGGGLPWAPR